VFRGLNITYDDDIPIETCGIFPRKGFISTSLYPKSPLEYVHRENPASIEDPMNNWESSAERPWCCLLAIYIPVGSRFLSLQLLSEFYDEVEILLPRTTRLRLVKKESIYINKPNVSGGDKPEHLNVLICELCPHAGRTPRARLGGGKRKSKGKKSRKSRKCKKNTKRRKRRRRRRRTKRKL
tara:strand:+ start:493 stop:1038 length:546 start_codon:yes stop_codon:yes gene_type:complete